MKPWIYLVVIGIVLATTVNAYAESNIDQLIGKTVIVVPFNHGGSSAKGTIGTLKEINKIVKGKSKWNRFVENYIIIEPYGRSGYEVYNLYGVTIEEWNP